MTSAATKPVRAPQRAVGEEAWRTKLERQRSGPAASPPPPRLDEARRRTLPPDQVLHPPGYVGFWADADKHAVVAAVLHGQITIGQALRDYMLSLEEFGDWLEAFRRGPVMTPCQVERRVLLGEVRQWL